MTSHSGLAEVAVPIAPRRHQHVGLFETELTERIVPAIRQDTRDLSGPQLPATVNMVSPVEKAYLSTYTSQRSLLVRGAPAFERSQHICFPIRILLEFQQIRSALSGPFFQILRLLIGLLTGTGVDLETSSRGFRLCWRPTELIGSSGAKL